VNALPRLLHRAAHSGSARALAILIALVTMALSATVLASADTSHAGWPRITGVLLMNKRAQSRPLDARPGHDPFDGADPSYSCNGEQRSTSCFPRSWWHCRSDSSGALRSPHFTPRGAVTASVKREACGESAQLVVIVGSNTGHNMLLGGDGNNTIHAGPDGDVIWGDFEPSGDPTTQVNYLYGGPGNDIIYAAHGASYIWTGGGRDLVHATWGRGAIHCQSPTVTVDISHHARPHYKLYGCKHIIYD
jgi:hypothetical protein